MRQPVLVSVLAATLAVLATQVPERAAAFEFAKYDNDPAYGNPWWNVFDPQNVGKQPPNLWKPKTGQASATARAHGPTSARVATFATTNLDATVRTGEPTEGGRMHETIWGVLEPEHNYRFVVTTFGTEFDTLLAAYRGTTFANFKRLTGNDDRAAAGVSTKQSLIQFNVAAGSKYRVQIGSRAEGEGDDVFANVFRFPPQGGISAWLATVQGGSVEGRDFICIVPSSCIPTFQEPTFVVHNSMATPVRVTAEQTFGAGVAVPAPFTLAAGQLKVVTFRFIASFDTTTTRTVSGLFDFTARSGSTIVSQAQIPGFILVKQSGEPDVLKVTVDQPARAGRVNQWLPFRFKVTNTGTTLAKGCLARSTDGSRLKVVFRRINPTTGNPIADWLVPANIPARASASFEVWVASQEDRIGDPTAVGDVEVDCANTHEAAFDLRGSVDISADGLFVPANVQVAAPSASVLNVPAGGASFAIRAVNKGPAATLTARPRYSGWFSDPANSSFTGRVCRTNTFNGACIAPASPAVTFSAPVGTPRFFKVFVKAPAVNPGADQSKRRMFLNFTQRQPPPYQDAEAVLVGAQSVAVRKN